MMKNTVDLLVEARRMVDNERATSPYDWTGTGAPSDVITRLADALEAAESALPNTPSELDSLPAGSIIRTKADSELPPTILWRGGTRFDSLVASFFDRGSR